MTFPEKPTLEGTRIGKVIDIIKGEFESNFKHANTSKILGGTSCDDDNVNYLVCIFSIPYISPKIIINEEHMEFQDKLFNFSKMETEDFIIEDLKTEHNSRIHNTLNVSFNVRCTF